MRMQRKEPEELNFWQSYSDMMAALLLVFVLIIMFVMTRQKQSYSEMLESLSILEEDIEAREAENDQYRKKVAEQQALVDEIYGIREDAIVKLKDVFKDSGLNLVIDPETGTISFDSSVLFDYNKYQLKQEGRAFLDEFFPLYFEAILSEELVEYVAEVIIEGHTDMNGSYLYNLDLSQKRAFSVAEYCLAEGKMFADDELDLVREIVTANGRSYCDPVYDTEGQVDDDASRRVEVKFRLTEEDMMKEIQNALESVE